MSTISELSADKSYETHVQNFFEISTTSEIILEARIKNITQNEA